MNYTKNPFTTLTESKVPTVFNVEKFQYIDYRKLEQPVLLKEHVENVFLNGWAFDSVAKKTAGAVYVAIDDKFFKTVYGKARQDVATIQKNPALLNCGFSIEMPVGDIGLGEHIVSLYVTSNDGKSYFKTGFDFQFILVSKKIRIKEIKA